MAYRLGRGCGLRGPVADAGGEEYVMMRVARLCDGLRLLVVQIAESKVGDVGVYEFGREVWRSGHTLTCWMSVAQGSTTGRNAL